MLPRTCAARPAVPQSSLQEGDRERIAGTLNNLWRLITEINFGPDAAPPVSHFARETAGTLERAQTYQIFTDEGGRPSRKAMAADLDIQLADPDDPEDAMQPAAAPAPAPGMPAEFSRALLHGDQLALEQAIAAVDSGDQSAILAPILAPVFEMARTDPTTLLAKLGAAYPQMDQSGLIDLMTRMLFVADTWGRLNAAGETTDAGDA